LEYRETLLTIAELAVALAGFASLVSVIGGRPNDASRVSASLRLRAMLEIALRNAVFALLPLPFLQFAPSDPVVWRISSGVYVAATAGHFLLRLRWISSKTGFQQYYGDSRNLWEADEFGAVLRKLAAETGEPAV